MVREESSDYLRQPAPLLGDRLVHPPPQLLLDLPELGPHTVPPGFPLEQKRAPAATAADEGEPQKIEGFRFTEPSPLAPGRRTAAKLDQAGLVRMERQCKLLEPRTHRIEKAMGIALMLEAKHQIVGIAHDNHVASGLVPSPAFGPLALK